MAKKKVFFVWSKQMPMKQGSSAIELPARFDTKEEADRYCEQENKSRASNHPGYFVQEKEVDD